MKRYYALIALVCLLYSCGSMEPVNYRYGTAMDNHPQMYLPKPMSTDDKKTANYLSAGGSIAPGVDQNSVDQIISGYAVYNHSQTFTNFSYSVGGYSFGGLYQNNTQSNSGYKKQPTDAYFDNKFFYGLGLQTSACLVTVNDNTEVRPIGVEFSYNNEFGNYLQYRQTASQTQYIYTDRSATNVNIGISTEVIFHARRNLENQYGFRLYGGKSLVDHIQSNNSSKPGPVFTNSSYNASFSFFLQISQYCLIYETSDIQSARIRLGYRF